MGGKRAVACEREVSESRAVDLIFAAGQLDSDGVQQVVRLNVEARFVDKN